MADERRQARRGTGVGVAPLAGGVRGGAAPAGAAAPAPAAFAFHGLRGEATAPSLAVLAGGLPGLLDPAGARRTLHWGRNYLWLADWPEAGAVVVKQFRHESPRARLRKRWKGSKARASFAVARQLLAAGVPTPEPLLWADSVSTAGPSYYVCRYLPDAVEARYPLRAMNRSAEPQARTEVGGAAPAAGGDASDVETPPVAPDELLDAAAATARSLHGAGFWHRDYSAGNLLLVRREGALVAYLLDLNRCRHVGAPSLSQRLRDLARLPVFRREHQERLLAAYFGAPPAAAVQRLYRLYLGSFHGRHRLKNALRGKGAGGGRAGRLDVLRPRRAYPHLAPPPPAATLRDRVVWDPLSDQPHQHAGRGGKLLVRLADAATHGRAVAVAAAAAPRVRRRYRELVAAAWRQPVPFTGLGVALRPHPEDPPALLAAFDRLGLRHALLRLHPWQSDHAAEEALARDLHARGVELVFALPQRRELVRDLPRWRLAVGELAARFAPYGRTFQVGHGINRSKWGVWSLREYQALARAAAEELAAVPDVQLVGPGVIDFEPHATIAAANWPGLGVRFHALASLLYVDRRGRPEARQLGFDALGKAALLRAVAETARWCGPRSWVTEVNWPLREGPHSPAGRDVAVDEETAADYLTRYYLLVLASGMAERVYWWQLVARGYGLAVAEPGAGGDTALRLRPAFHALTALAGLLGGATCAGELPAPPGLHLLRFTTADGGERLAGWAAAGPGEAELPWAPAAAWDRDGRELPPPGPRVRLGGGVTYFAR